MKAEPILSKKEYDKKRYIENRVKILRQCANYRKNNRRLERDRAKKYYQNNRDSVMKRAYKNKKRNNWYYNEHTKNHSREWHRRPENRIKDSVRGKTRYKYGKLPSGFEYHHPIPYKEDVWLGVPVEEHSKWENR